eukprot:c505_g1_i1.p1 GENE.c505_g1_i1~~c505_g1_i1.p1  ORF type:complete len:780 (-),score=144.78 c505_g1_i1:239-2518(-)
MAEPLTPQQQKHIRKGIDFNPLFRFLDEEQKRELISNCKKQKFSKGTFIVREEDIGDCFYVVESGAVNVLQIGPGGVQVHAGNYTIGESFGEKAMFFDSRRSGSAVAATDTECWYIDRPTFHRVLMTSKEKRSKFEAFATSTNPESPQEKLMRPADFIRSMKPDIPLEGLNDEQVVSKVTSEYPRLTTLFQLVDRANTGTINFLDFCLFDVIASKPDPYLDFAFLMFDEHNKGYVNLEDVRRVLTKPNNSFTFDFDCSFMSRFFGADGSRRLRYLSFTEFFLGLQEEIPRQAFLNSENSSGRVSGDQFLDMLNEFGLWRLPPGVLQRVKTMRGVHPTHEGVSYAEFVAFNKLLNHLPGVVTILRHAMNQNGGNPVTREEFINSAQMLNSVRPSPLELAIVYNLCDPNKTGTLSLLNFMDVAGLSRQHAPSQLPVSKQTHLTATQRAKEAALNFLLGSFAGAIGAATVYPIDFVKTRLQNQPYDSKGKGSMYNGIIDCFRKSIKSEGVRGLYRGLPAQLIGVAPEKAIKLATNDLLRGLFKNENQEVNFPLEVLAGGCAGGMQVFFTNPYELVKIRLQVQGTLKNTPGYEPKSAVTLVKEIGFRGLYKGASACWLRDIPFSAIYFPMYANVKKRFEEPLSKTDLLLSGAIAGAPAAYLATPADVVKTRLQADAKSGKQRFAGLRDCFLKTYREEGFRVFFVGGGMRVFRSSPQFAVTLLVYEVLQKYFAPTMQSPRPPVAPVTSEEFMRASHLKRILPPL